MNIKSDINLVVCVLVGLIFNIGGLRAQETKSQPNIIIIFTDDQGYRDIGCYGSEFATPNIDQLASEGMRFTNFYSASAICTPSRFGVLTGKNPGRSQDRLLYALMFQDESNASVGIHGGETTLPQVLKTAGYQTALIGKWHLGHGRQEFSPLQHGFDFSYGHTAGCVDYFTLTYGNTPDWYRNDKLINQNGYATDLITDETISYLKNRDKEKPFFLFLAYNAPHFGKGWDDGKDQTVNLLQPHPRDLARVKDIKDPARRRYASMVVTLDDGIGNVMKYLDQAGLKKNTIVIFMSDHGGDPNYGGDNTPLRNGKATLFDGGIKVPFIVRWPEKVKANTVTNELTWSLDLFPTLASITGAKHEGVLLDGQDIQDVFNGKNLPDNREMYWELGNHSELERGHWEAYRKGNWKYVRSPLDGEWLFDLSADPYEKENLVMKEPRIFESLKSNCEVYHSTYVKYSAQLKK